MKLTVSFLFSLFFLIQAPHCQNKKYKIRTISFYNVENLFDTIDNPETFDDERTPSGKYQYNSKIYRDKLYRIASVISEIGKEKTNTSPAIIGLAEIENQEVLKDLINTEFLKNKSYQYIHYDSKDLRGIDVALLYQEKYFSPIAHEIFELRLWDEKGMRLYTRDILKVSGYLDDELVHIIINHWPSRRGGVQRSAVKREKAAWLCNEIIQTIKEEENNPKIVVMGDFNDDPMDNSFKEILRSKSHKNSLKPNELFNPMEEMYKKGLNTLGYRDNLNLFDQILVSASLITNEKDFKNFNLFQAQIFNPNYLITQSGRYKGYPFRSYSGTNYSGGYSDHFPVYIYLIKEVIE
ncbi:MAG: endonuclease/exonuclease/phosphatase family protein [Bacteroidota bacterium]